MSESEQNLAGRQIHEEKLRRYLLGQCSADESAEIERAAFQDNSVSDALSVIEDELTEDYVGDQLNDFDRSCFELKFLTTSERREKLRLSALLLNRTEVLRRVPPGFVRAHQLMSQEMKEAFDEEVFYMNEPETGDRDSPGVALPGKMPGSIPIALGSAASRWKRWTALGAAAVVLVLAGYGIRGRLSTPVKTPPPVMNPLPSVASVDLQTAQGLGVRNDPHRLLLHTFLLVKGRNFTEGATVQWNGSNLETLFIDSTTLGATLPEADLPIAKNAKFRIVVVNPPPGGGPSAPFILTRTPVLNPSPSIASVEFQESDPRLGFLHPILIVKGENFSKGARVRWNGLNLDTLFIDSTTLAAIYPETSELTANTAKIQIVVVNPPPGNGESPPFILTPTLER